VTDVGPLLAGVRVLDLGDGTADMVTRLLADLGADVLKIEPEGGNSARTAPPRVGDVSIPFALHNANKRSAVVNSHQEFLRLAQAADIVVDSGRTPAFGMSCAELADRFDHLVTMSVTDFGTTGPRAGWRATDPVLYAMSTALSRSGPPTGTPVLPPDGIASATAAAQAAWAVLAAYYHRMRSGTGDFVDFSRLEGVLLALDPPFGSMGQAAANQVRPTAWRGRPRNQDVYPIFACADGFVRICVMSGRQWRGMRAWLGEPSEFQDPKFETLSARITATRELGAMIGELFSRHTMEVLLEGGQRHGVPIAAVHTPAEVLASEHFRSVGALTELACDGGVGLTAPAGNFVVDGRHAGIRHPAPSPGRDAAEWLSRPEQAAAERGPARRPLEGVRVLDLGVIVAGGELGRLFADLGAEVIKIESASYPDGLRQTRDGQSMGETFALTHRNEYGLGLDLRTDTGADIFRRLIAESDAVFANFKPGTLAALGFSYDQMCAINPRIVLAESSAYGDAGPWSARMGYGPLVRASTGITRLWTSDDDERAGRPAFSDATTVFPDHVSARITAIAALAALVRRDRSGTGAQVHISQAEVAMNQLDTLFVTEAARTAGLAVVDDAGIHAVYPCAGEDEWCVISIRSDEERAAIGAAMGRVDVPTDPHALRAEIAAWTSGSTKDAVVERLQRAGVAAGAMCRPPDVLADAQIRLRRVFSDMIHPLLPAPLPSEAGCAPYRHIPAAEQRPAPMPGQHTREICHEVLHMDADETDRLIAEGVLFSWTEPDRGRGVPS
jgi:crotonobetainyl-CoA:carnitine CoA-transferase CaiB-like acyl-CoA transferase